MFWGILKEENEEFPKIYIIYYIEKYEKHNLYFFPVSKFEVFYKGTVKKI